jgi:glycosyltransferase involved in cell wall biosynthesis
MSLRILYTVHGYKPAYRLGGPIISVPAVAERLVRRGHQVVVFTTDSNADQDLDVPLNQPVDVDGVKVWYFSRKDFTQRLFFFLPYFAKSIGFMYNARIPGHLERLLPGMDLVHAHNPFIYPTYAAARAAHRLHKPLFFNQRGVFDPERLKFRSVKKRLYINLVVRPLLQKATTLIALTEAEVQSYRALGLVPPCRIIPNGIEVAAYRQHPGPTVEAIFQIPPQAQVILFMGRVHPIKGTDRLLEAFLQIQARLPDAVLVIAGPDEWGWGKKFQQMVGSAGLSDRVIFPGMVSGEAKLDLLARADLFCLPSDAEGFSMAVLEALASRTAVLLSPGCYFPEVVSAGAGWVVPPTPIALAQALVDLLGQPDRLRTMGARGLEFVRDNYSWDHITDQLLDVYLEGIQRHERFYGKQAASISRQTSP